MDIYGKIKEKIQAIAGAGSQRVVIFPAQVKEITGNTCSVVIDELLITGVRLRAVINDNAEQLLITPKIGSYVLVTDLSGGNYRNLAVISYSEVTAVNITIGSMKATINADGITFNDGTLGGLVKLQELKDNLDSLKEYVEAIHNALPSALSAIGVGSAANGGTGATSYQGAMAGKAIQIKDMENDKVKQ
ncbi:MAG: hypothetical protein LBN98_01740 [Prevotellaceae bacterium]|jgi:hypothetical protein|nr:hypothetical protein [Prevotellaceae bacterium]